MRGVWRRCLGRRRKAFGDRLSVCACRRASAYCVPGGSCLAPEHTGHSSKCLLADATWHPSVTLRGMLRMDDFASVIYSAGKVFDNLRTRRLATEEFLANGSTAGIASRADLQLLQDLQDAARIALRAKHDRQPVTVELVCALNAAILCVAAGCRHGESDSWQPTWQWVGEQERLRISLRSSRGNGSSV